ncbi:hypothetical protein [uncultured Nocardioides sp.]|uniref:hypothetical protein n=1 Tax=Nocardioides sp. T5 TaxID=3400182 RepID=UPI0026251B3B|nr:hypothetical protein [uncultured Nocardioides sp.]
MDQDDSVEAEGSGDGPPQDHKNHPGIVHSATDRFLSSTRMLVEQIAKVGGAGAQAVVPGSVLSTADHMLTSMREVVESAPQVGAELEIVMREIRAKRLTIQAIEAELSVLDDQLEVLERSLAPLQAWSNQWSKLQHTLLHSLDPPSEEQD